jgi:hypothetical protein
MIGRFRAKQNDESKSFWNATLSVDGVDISKHCTGFSIDCKVGNTPEIVIHMIAAIDEVEITGDANPRIKLLGPVGEKFGWFTPEFKQ